MKPYIYSILFFLITNTIFSQTEEVLLDRSYLANETTILNLDLDNAIIVFEESKDDKIHFNYKISYNKNAKQKIKKYLKQSKIETSKNGNTVTLDAKNSMYLKLIYSSNGIDFDTSKKHIKNIFSIIKNNKFLYKSRDSVLKEIGFSLGSDYDDYFKKLKLENPNKNYGKPSKKLKQQFIIKVPKNVKIKIKALHSKINFTYDVSNLLDLSSFKTEYKFKIINNKNNRFKLMHGIFQAEQISGGNYNLKDIHKVKIGVISSVKLETETSRIQIGEIGKNVSITDFNSKIYLYNFSNNFNKFDLKGDYSELSFYNILDNNYSLNIFGHNTVLNMNDKKTSFGLSKEKKTTKIIEKKAKTIENSFGIMEIELLNGIVNIK